MFNRGHKNSLRKWSRHQEVWLQLWLGEKTLSKKVFQHEWTMLWSYLRWPDDSDLRPQGTSKRTLSIEEHEISQQDEVKGVFTRNVCVCVWRREWVSCTKKTVFTLNICIFKNEMSNTENGSLPVTLCFCMNCTWYPLQNTQGTVTSTQTQTLRVNTP